MKKRFISTALLLAMLSALTSCQNSGGGGLSEKDTSGADPVTVPEDNSPKLNIPADADFGGETFTILMPTEKAYEYISEEANGDIVSDAVYRRNQKIEELLNIKFEFVDMLGLWNYRDTYKGAITSSILADDKAYDLVTAVLVIGLPLATEGYFVNANDVNYLNFDNPWWVANMNEDLALEGKLYTFVGDASLSMYKDINVVYFNKKISDDYGIDNMYELVREGKWTIDALSEKIKDVSADLNNDDKLTWGDDMFGILTQAVPNRSLLTSCEMSVISMNNGIPKVDDLSESFVNKYDKLYQIFCKNDNVITNPKDEYDLMTQYFTEDKGLFMFAPLYCTDNMRDMKSDFGILPYPKASEAQENYHSQVGTSTNTMFIPRTVEDTDMVGMVCEAMSYYSMNEVVPSYYEVALKEKYTRDDDVKDMLNIIRDGAQLGFSFAYSSQFAPFTVSMTEFRTKTSGPADNYASYHDSCKTKWQATLDMIIESYQALD